MEARDPDDELARPLAAPTTAFGRIVDGFNAVGGVLIFMVMLLVVADVLARNLIDKPIDGVSELVGASVIMIVFTQLASTLRHDRMSRADLFIDPFIRRRPAAGRVLRAVFGLVGVFVCAVLVYATWPKLVYAWTSDEFMGVEGIFTAPLWPMLLCVVAGAALTLLQYLVIVAGDLRAALSGRSQGGRRVSGIEIGGIAIALMLAAVYFGMHIGIALMAVSFVGIWLVKSPELAARMVAAAASDSIREHLFGVVPLFVLMGILVSVSQLGRDTFDVAQRVFARLRGGLGIATVAANAVFAAITGISIASASVFTKVAVPEMIRHGYTGRFAVGTVAGSSVLGMLIPPSLLFIVYGVLAEESVGRMFLAGVIPGLVLAFAFSVMIVLMAVFAPGFVGRQDSVRIEPEPLSRTLVKGLPVVALVVLVLGGLYGGIFTPTEAGAVGALVVALARRRLNGRKLWQTLIETGHVSVSVLFLIIAASLYSRMLALTGIPAAIGASILDLGLGPTGFIVAYIGVVVMLGCIIDSVSIMPIVLPIAREFGMDIIWFGVITVVAVEIGLLTPPFGLSAYTVKATLSRDSTIGIKDIFVGVAPFVACMLAVLALLALLVAFPALSTWLAHL